MKPLDVEALQATVTTIATLREARENWMRFRDEAVDRIRLLDKKIEDARCQIDEAIANATAPPILPPRSPDSAMAVPDVAPGGIIETNHGSREWPAGTTCLAGWGVAYSKP